MVRNFIEVVNILFVLIFKGFGMILFYYLFYMGMIGMYGIKVVNYVV